MSNKGAFPELKKKPGGEEARVLLRERLELQITDPQADKLARAVFQGLMDVLPTLSGTFLDVGCYTGWVYHFVKDKVDYHGIDNYKAALAVARERFPAERFSQEDLKESKRTADIVWATQLHPENHIESIMPRLQAMANKRVFWTGAILSQGFSRVIEHQGIYEGIK